MIKTIDSCVGCTSMGLYCKGKSCINHERKALVCDECETEEEEIYKFDGGEYCAKCVLEKLERVEFEDE